MMPTRYDNEDVTDLYLMQSGSAIVSSETREMEEWLRATPTPGAERPTVTENVGGAAVGQIRPKTPKPIRRKTDDPLGRPGVEGASDSLTTQALGGIDDAGRHALGFIEPVTEWLNNNVADLRYDPVPQPKTGSGQFVRKTTEFLTGFIPAMKGLRAIGVTGTLTQPALAGALADFVVRDPHEGRLADLWNDLGLPKNVLTDFLASNPDDADAEARFKNTLEGAITGSVFDGIVLTGRMLRAARAVKGVKETEEQILLKKYGSVSEEDIGRGVKGVESAPPVVAVRIGGKTYEAQKEEVTHGQIVNRIVKENPEAIAPKGKKTNAIEEGWTSEGKFLDRDETEKLFKVRDTQLDKNIKRALGDPSKPAIETSVRKPPAISKKIPKELERAPEFDPRAVIRSRGAKDILPEDFEIYVNFARFDEPEQVKFAIGKMAEAMRPHIDAARRGSKVTFKEMEEMADELGMSVADVLARRKGQLFNYEESIAARRLWAASGEQLVTLAKKAAGPNAGALDLYAFRKQMAVHTAIQSEVIGARTETARALASWRIEVKGGIERARAIEQVMNAMGGQETAHEMARRLAILADEGASAAMLARVANKGFAANTIDAIKEVWVNGLLSSPKTHAVNTLSNTLVAFQQIYERGAAAQIRNFVGGEGVVAGEATAMLFGAVESMKDAFRMSAKALRTGESGWSFNKIDVPRPHALSTDAFNMSRETTMGRTVDFLGSVTRVPGRLLVAEDEFFKTIGYRMELRAQALRMATGEGHRGRDLARRVTEITDNPPEHIRINSADAALYNTFTNEIGWAGRRIMDFRNAGGSLNPLVFVIPFVRTPVNIARYAFERSPFAPLVGQWRADIAAGGARADLALARMSTGTAIMMVSLDLADSGMISGEGPREKDADTREALLRQGWRPYSVKIGDRWFSYNRADPFGMTMGFAASIAEAVRRGELNEDDVDEWQEVTAMAIAAVSQVTISKTYLEGFSNFVEVMSDPSRYSKQYVDDLVASFLPFTSLSSSVKNIVDPIQREAGTPAEAVQARIAGLSDKLPPRRNLWGEPITSESQLGKLYDVVSPIASAKPTDSPIDKEIVRIGQGPERIAKQTTFDGVRVNMRQYPQVYDAYTELAGNKLKHPAWQMGAKDYLSAVVSGNHPMSAAYKILSDEGKRKFISNAVGEYRKLAQQQIMGSPQFRDFAKDVEYLKDINLQHKLPVLGE